MANPLKVVSLNCWGVPFVAKYRIQRMEAIAEHMLASQPDIVGLQEIWIRSDYQLLCDRLSSIYSHKYYFRSGVIGSGLAVFSKHPIVEVVYRRFSVNGKPHHLMHGDWLGGKGVGLCRIRLPTDQGDSILIDFYSTHLHACYATTPEGDEYMAHRMAQCWELMQFIRHTARNLVIISGDFNFDPSTLPYALLTAPLRSIGGGGYRDSFSETLRDDTMRRRMEGEVRRELGLSNDWTARRPSSSRHSDGGNSAVPFAALKERIYADAVRGATSHAHSNSFFVHDDMDDYERIDYVFYLPSTQFRCLYSRLTFLPFLADLQCSYSDHYGMEALFEIGTGAGSVPAATKEPHLSVVTDEEQISVESAKSKLYLNVSQANILPATVCVLTQGIKNARYRIRLYTLQSLVYGILWGLWIGKLARLFIRLIVITIPALLLGLGIYVVANHENIVLGAGWIATLFWISVIIYAWTWLLCFVSVMCRFVLPEELGALERIRSEVVLWASGHSTSSIDTQSSDSVAIDELLHPVVVEKLLQLAGVYKDQLSPTVSPTIANAMKSEYTAIPLAIIDSDDPVHKPAANIIDRDRRASITTRPKRTWSHPISPMHPPADTVARLEAGSGNRHRRHVSNMANPGPSGQQSGDFWAIATIQAALGGSSSDHSAAMTVPRLASTSMFSPHSPLLEEQSPQPEDHNMAKSPT